MAITTIVIRTIRMYTYVHSCAIADGFCCSSNSTLGSVDHPGIFRMIQACLPSTSGGVYDVWIRLIKTYVFVNYTIHIYV